MGGGAAMRSAAKVAGIGVANAGIRGAGTGIPAAAEHPVVQRAGQAIRPATITATGDAPAAAQLQQKPAWELDDWEFAGFEELEPPARLVFGPVPTLEEAKSATSELKDVLEKVSLAPNAQTGVVGPFGATGLSLLSNPDYSETKDCVTSNSRAAALPIPSALQAFKLLNESSAAQSVVASIASDPNVWDAVLRNPTLQEFVQTQKTTMDTESEESVGDVKFQDPRSSKKSVEQSDDESIPGKQEKQENGFMHLLENIKVTIVDMANNAFAHLQSLFGFSSAENASPASDGSTNAAYAEKTLAASFMGLAVMVIMMVAIKRA